MLLPISCAGAENNADLRLVYDSYCKYTAGMSRALLNEGEGGMVMQQLYKLCLDMELTTEGGENEAK